MDQILPLEEWTAISLESTTYPGTTEEIIYEEIKKKGLSAGKDIFITYSPEREDPEVIFHLKKFQRSLVELLKNAQKEEKKFTPKFLMKLLKWAL